MGFDVQTAAAQASQAQAAIANAPAAAQQAWDQATSPTANAGRIEAGADAAAGLVAHGYDSSNPSDNQALIATIAGALSCIPGGAIFGGAIMLLDSVAEGIAAGLEALGLIPKPGCTSSGTFTPANVLADWIALGADVTPGTFGALAWPVLAANVARWKNCQKGGVDNAMLLAGLVELWNRSTSGAPVDVYVPHVRNYGDPFERYGASLGGRVLFANGNGTEGPYAAVFQPTSALVAPPGLIVPGFTTVSLKSGPFQPAPIVYRVAVGVHGAAGRLAQQTIPSSRPLGIALVLAVIGGLGALFATRR